jgi:hypothetical protein
MRGSGDPIGFALEHTSKTSVHFKGVRARYWFRHRGGYPQALPSRLCHIRPVGFTGILLVRCFVVSQDCLVVCYFWAIFGPTLDGGLGSMLPRGLFVSCLCCIILISTRKRFHMIFSESPLRRFYLHDSYGLRSLCKSRRLA